MERLGLETLPPERRCVLLRTDCQGRWSYPLHSHQGFSDLFYLARGTMEQHIEGRVQRLEAGTLALVRERDHHRLLGEGLRYYNMNVVRADLERVLAYIDGGSALSARLAAAEPLEPLALAPADRREVEERLARLLDDQATPAAGPQFQGLLVLLFSLLARGRPAETAPGLPAWLAEAMAEAVADLPGTTPGVMAKRAGVSPAHLARSLRRHAGLAPAAWLNRHRLERAALRLAHTNQPVAAISADLGFATLGWFYRAFRRTHGCPPADYRRRYGVRTG